MASACTWIRCLRALTWLTVGVALAGCDGTSSSASLEPDRFDASINGRSELARLTDDLLISSRFGGEVLRYNPDSRRVVWRYQHAEGSQHPSGPLATLGQNLAVLYPSLGRWVILDTTDGSTILDTSLGQKPSAIVASRQHWWVADRHDQALLQLSPDGHLIKRYTLDFAPGPLRSVPPDELLIGAATGRDWQRWQLTEQGARPSVAGQWRTSTQHAGALMQANDRVWAALQQVDTGSPGQPATHDTAIRPFLVAQDSQTPAEPLLRQALDLSGQIFSRPMDLSYDPSTETFWLLGGNSNEVRHFRQSTTYTGGDALSLGHHPRAQVMNIEQRRLYIWEALDFSLAIVDLDSAQLIARHRVQPKSSPDESWLAGARLFHDASSRRASSGWMACDSCHLDGGLDLQTWHLGDGPRNTPALGGSLDAMPLHWSGDRDELQDFERTFRDLMGGSGYLSNAPTGDALSEITAGRSDALDHLAHYLSSLPPISGQREPDTEMVSAGRTVFRESGCDTCHQTDGQPVMDLDNNSMRSRVDVGTQGAYDDSALFDVPTLYGLAFTAPYLHDGRAETLEALLTTHNAADQHGQTSQLSQAQRQQLIAFLHTL